MPSFPENLFTYTFPDNIWRILPHPSLARDEWAVELRNPEQKTVSWAILDLAVPELRWKVSPEATDWWSTLTAFSGSCLYLHNYRYPEIPEPTDLLALSALDGTLRWALPGWVYVRNQPQSDLIVVGRKLPESIEYRMADSDRGIITDKEPTEDASPPEDTRLPVRYEPGDIYFDVLSSFLCKIAGVTDPIAIDYLESDPYIVFSYYIYEQEYVTQYLLVVNRQKEIVSHELLSANRQGLGLHTLVWKAGRVVCLRNNNELISLKLTP